MVAKIWLITSAVGGLGRHLVEAALTVGITSWPPTWGPTR
jgi:hypothetical protein